MKTPIQEVIDFVNDINDNDRSGFDYYYQSIMNKLNELLEKEKEQIIDAYENGVGDENERNLSGNFTNAEQYYNQTYNQNK
jgi:hypothetical protein